MKDFENPCYLDPISELDIQGKCTGKVEIMPDRTVYTNNFLANQ